MEIAAFFRPGSFYAFCQGRCKAFINLFPVFFAATEADKDWYEHLFILGDDHFSAAGNRFMFREMARHLL